MYTRERETISTMLTNHIASERDNFRKQRDELINDIAKLRERNAELERKAQAFDEIVNAVDESANSYELVARIKLEVLKYQKLERGSNVED
ncbi:hypothetical protein BUY49_11330 [Staphylococcus devriesei]|uniref:hypothetical protein n=1 Tax=Staphylococcus devriesei TaxID=586733 RepID=UPI000E6A1D75|nr:hypothetical protein [Staphylococcus devriesei]RIL69372.1 hypothetical protein BUY49_11330 [Staphylococcus devriesei]